MGPLMLKKKLGNKYRKYDEKDKEGEERKEGYGKKEEKGTRKKWRGDWRLKTLRGV